jgi:invasion protein IalB
MIIPSSIRLPKGEQLQIEDSGDGAYSFSNAYQGTHQEGIVSDLH